MDYAAFYEQHLGKVKWGPKGEGMARCPFHEDKTPSLAVNRLLGLWFCHGCAEGGTARQFAERLGVAAPPSRPREPDAIYVYTDEAGKPLFRKVRMPGKKFHLERYAGPGRWEKGLGKTRRVLYRLHKLVKATGLIFVPEGEKDVESLVRLGLEATTNPMGAGKWLPEYNEYFRGRPVAILADNDAPGGKHAHDVARNLHGIAASVKVLKFPELPKHGDVSDAIARGLTKEQLLARVEQTPEWTPALIPPARPEGQPLEQAWPGRIPPQMHRLVLPAGYTGATDGLRTAEGALVTTTPILPMRIVEDVHSQERSYEVLLLEREASRLLPVPAQDLHARRRIVALTASGLDVSDLTAGEVIKFLTAYLRANRLERIRQTDRLGWTRWEDGAAYVLHDIHPAGAPIHPLTDTEEARELLAALRPSGDLEGVRAILRATATYPIVVTTLCTSLAPALREILRLDVKNFWLHLAAESGTGKSLTQQAALSVWAQPMDSPWLAHGHATFAGVEKLCLRTFGLPVFVEDAHLIRDKDRPDLIMAVANQRFKARGGDRPRPQFSWHGAVISSGELGLLDETSLEGMGARLITLGPPPFGKHCPETGRFLQETLIPLLREHYGLLGPLLITRLLQADAEEHTRLVAWWARCRDKFAQAAAGHRNLVRQAPIWALLALAGRLITQTLELQLTPAPEDQVWEAFAEAQRQPAPDPVRSAYEYVLSYAESNRPFFYVRTAEGISEPREASTAGLSSGIGERDTAPKEGRPHLGVINERKGYVALFPNVLRDLLARANLGGAERFLRAWRERGWLLCTGDDLTHPVKIAGRVPRLYALKLPEAEQGTPDAV